MKILKFGGSSVGNAERIKAIVEIIKQSKNHHGEIVVVLLDDLGLQDLRQVGGSEGQGHILGMKGNGISYDLDTMTLTGGLRC